MFNLKFITAFTRRTIRTQLLVLAVIVALPALGIIVYTGLESRRHDYDAAVVRAQLQVDGIAAQMEQIAHEVKQLSFLLSNLPEVRDRNRQKTSKVLSVLQAQHPEYSRILIADAEGDIWASSMPSERYHSVSDRFYFKKAKASLRFSSGEHVISKTKKESSFHMAHPIVDSGRFSGVVIFAFDLGPLQAFLTRTRVPENPNYVVVDRNGIILSHGKDDGQEVGKPIAADELKKMQHGPDKETYEFVPPDGERRILSYRKLTLHGETAPYMFVRAGLSKSEALAGANRVLLYNAAICIPFVILAFMVAMLIGRRSIVDKVARLREAATQIGRGNLETRVAEEVKGGELGEFALAFDGMARALQAEMLEKQAMQDVLLLKQGQLQALNDTLEQRVEAALADLRQKDYILVQQNRLSAMGEMINYIAHQWRQPLNLIGLIAQGISINTQTNTATVEEIEKDVEGIMLVVKQMSQTIDDFRNFFLNNKERTEFSVKTAVEKVIVLMKPILNNKGIRYNIHISSDAVICGYRNEYIQALINIVNNAIDILTERAVPEPKIDIFVCNSDNMSVVKIVDNGGGIDQNIITRIFDPYFTTKDNNLGTGIGLYMSKVIIENNMGGRVSVDNFENGALFCIEV